MKFEIKTSILKHLQKQYFFNITAVIVIFFQHDFDASTQFIAIKLSVTFLVLCTSIF